MSRISPQVKAVVRQQALRRMCLGKDGKLTKDAQVVLAELRRFCNGDGKHPFPRAADGKIDQTAMVQVAGRREVFDLLVRMLAVPLDTRHNLEDV